MAFRRWPIVAAALALAIKQGGLIAVFGLDPGPLLPLAALASGVALLAPAALFRGRAQVVAAAVLDALGSLILFADLVHARHYADVFSAASLRFAGQLGDETGAVLQLIRASDLLLFADVVLLLAASRFVGGLERLRASHAFALFAGSATIVALVGMTAPAGRGIPLAHAWPISHMGSLAFHASDMLRAALRPSSRPPVSPGLVDAIAADLAERRERDAGGSPYRGFAAGRNLIVVQVESLQGFALGATVGGTPVTPHLDALAREAMVFDRFHHQTGLGVTSDADYAFNCASHPLPGTSVYVQYGGGEFRCLPTLLAERGYATAAFQAIRRHFWNLATAYPRIGYQRFDALDAYTRDELQGHGLTDRAFVAQTIPRLEALREPFFAFLVTLTSHIPFDLGEPLPADPRAGPAVARYLSAIRYTDHALGDLVDGLRRSGLLDRSILVLYGDHLGMRRSAELSAFLGIGLAPGADAAWFEVERRIPLLIRLPGGAGAGRRETLGGQVDLAPTLAALLGVEVASAPFIGRDLLTGPAPLVAFPDGSAVDGTRIHDAPPLVNEPRCLDAADGRRLPAADCAPLAETAALELSRSRAVVEDRLLPALRLGVRPRQAPSAAPR
jgi:lipoteichoic acid synthase